jgi:FAD:protein FMN transferase
MKNKSLKKILIVILLLVLVSLILLFIDKSSYKDYTRNYFYFDTYINVKVNTVKSEREMNDIFNDIDYLYDSYHKLTDAFDSYDGIVNVYYLNNNLNNNENIEIDTRLANIIKLGIDFYDTTDGLFNVAAGNLTIKWKEFIDSCNTLPSTEELNVNTNINDIKLDGNNYSKSNDVKLDLGGIAKGYVTELVGRYLEENDIHSYIINAGGNVMVGKAYNKDTFLVGITSPDNKDDMFTKVKVNNLSIVTSGSYQRYCTLDGINYNHIINPITKYPSNYMKSVTVVGKSSILADIYSTYLFLLPVEDGLKIVNNNPDIEAIWYVDKDIESKLKQIQELEETLKKAIKLKEIVFQYYARLNSLYHTEDFTEFDKIWLAYDFIKRHISFANEATRYENGRQVLYNPNNRYDFVSEPLGTYQHKKGVCEGQARFMQALLNNQYFKSDTVAINGVCPLGNHVWVGSVVNNQLYQTCLTMAGPFKDLGIKGYVPDVSEVYPKIYGTSSLSNQELMQIQSHIKRLRK